MRKIYFVKATVFDLESEQPEAVRIVNYSDASGRDFLDRLVFSCINTGKGVAIELDRTEPEAVKVNR